MNDNYSIRFDHRVLAIVAVLIRSIALYPIPSPHPAKSPQQSSLLYLAQARARFPLYVWATRAT
ncbi:hypothetical protein, partial [Microcoleus sp. OTE_8_concoct_300]|uniref:hypothetical protein n=1 Tax=Microcoleus sp. OTE_8_concoct_300 TaxID=2964710 RepID=UPI00403F56BE